MWDFFFLSPFRSEDVPYPLASHDRTLIQEHNQATHTPLLAILPPCPDNLDPRRGGGGVLGATVHSPSPARPYMPKTDCESTAGILCPTRGGGFRPFCNVLDSGPLYERGKEGDKTSRDIFLLLGELHT